MVPTEINTGNYDNFTAGVGTVDKLNKALETRKTEFEGYKNSLNNESVFAGPMCDSAVEAFTNLGKMLDSTVTNFSKIGEYINQVLSNYQDADSDALAYLNIKDDGTLATSTTAPSGDQDLVNALNKQIGKKINDFGDSKNRFHDGEWCADFVSYQLKKNGYEYDWAAGATTDSDQWSIIKSMKDGGATIHYGQNAADYEGRTLTDEDKNYVPQPGDVFTIEVNEGSGPGHTGFIVKDNGDGTVTTIEGNTYKEEPGYKEKFINDEVPGVVEIHTDRKKSDIYAYATPEKNN